MKVLSLLVLSLVVAGSLWVATANTQALSFHGNGVVEEVHYSNNHCTVKVAIYEWVSLSDGFTLSEIPQQSQRYIFEGHAKQCQALPVAMSSTNQHISFEVKRKRQGWFFTSRPEAAISCGGLAMNWLPDPES